MGATLETIHRDMHKIKNELCFLRHLMEEEYDFSEKVRQQLEIARKTPRSEYISHEDVKKNIITMNYFIKWHQQAFRVHGKLPP